MDLKAKRLPISFTEKNQFRVSEEHFVNLVRSIAAADQGALHSLFEHTHRLVFTLALRITDNPATAEELTLDVFHDIWRRASTYDPAGGPVVGWIMNQARSRAIDRLRFEQRKKRTGNAAMIRCHTVQTLTRKRALISRSKAAFSKMR